jgi:tRNA threonylcarbamoyladenosine biosynthesis protein TsaE
MSASDAAPLPSDGPDDTARIAEDLAATLRPGDVVLVEGEMGAGKTTFVRAAARALGVTERVTSPTFTIGRRYTSGSVPVSHLDLHRLATLEGEDPALLADHADGRSVVFVEWPEIAEADLAALGRVAARVRLEHRGGDRREVTVRR